MTGKIEKKTIHCDMLVVGGILEGCMAALAAAENGKRVVLTETKGSLGGLASNGLRSWFDSEDNKTNPLREKLFYALGMKGDWKKRFFYPDQQMKLALAQMLADAGVKVLTHVFLSEPILEGEAELKGFTLYGKTGEIAVLADTVTDATPLCVCARVLDLPMQDKPTCVGAAVKLNGVDIHREGTADNDADCLGEIQANFSKEMDGLRFEAGTLTYHHNRDRDELILHGMGTWIKRADTETLSAVQLHMHPFAYDFLAWAGENLTGFSNARIIHVAHEMNTYGLCRLVGTETPYPNLLFCNGRN